MTESEPYANKRAKRVTNSSHPSRVRVLRAIGTSWVVDIRCRLDPNPIDSLLLRRLPSAAMCDMVPLPSSTLLSLLTFIPKTCSGAHIIENSFHTFCRDDFVANRVMNQISQRMETKLEQNVGAMRLDSPDGNSQFCSYFL